MDKVLFPELSYKIVGIAYDVFNQLGYGYQEKIYQKAVSAELKRLAIGYTEQLCCKMSFNDQEIGRYFLDFLVDGKVVVELKVGNMFYRRDYEQVKNYLKINNLELGILVLFSKTGVKFKRILNSLK